MSNYFIVNFTIEHGNRLLSGATTIEEHETANTDKMIIINFISSYSSIGLTIKVQKLKRVTKAEYTEFNLLIS